MLLAALPVQPAGPLSRNFPLLVPLQSPVYGCGMMLCVVFHLPHVCVCMCALILLYHLHEDTHVLGVDGNGKETQLLSFSSKEKVERTGNAMLRQS